MTLTHTYRASAPDVPGGWDSHPCVGAWGCGADRVYRDDKNQLMSVCSSHHHPRVAYCASETSAPLARAVQSQPQPFTGEETEARREPMGSRTRRAAGEIGTRAHAYTTLMLFSTWSPPCGAQFMHCCKAGSTVTSSPVHLRNHLQGSFHFNTIRSLVAILCPVNKGPLRVFLNTRWKRC